MDTLHYKDNGLEIAFSLDFDDDLEITKLIHARIERRKQRKERPFKRKRGRPRKSIHLSNR